MSRAHIREVGFYLLSHLRAIMLGSDDRVEALGTTQCTPFSAVSISPARQSIVMLASEWASRRESAPCVCRSSIIFPEAASIALSMSALAAYLTRHSVVSADGRGSASDFCASPTHASAQGYEPQT